MAGKTKGQAVADGVEHHLDGFASLANEDPFQKISKQPPPTDPRIKELLSRALMKPETLSAGEIQEMAASLVYHLLSEAKT